MRCVNLADPGDVVSFRDALFRGLGVNGGLYQPASWPRLPPAEIDALLGLSRQERAARLALRLLGDEFDEPTCRRITAGALDFPIPLTSIEPGRFALELFHGPTLAFKDVGARFLARAMEAARHGPTPPAGPITILTATSGDTGSAVAQAFHGAWGIEVVILYPAGRISTVQEMQIVTPGGNVHALAVDGDFDHCQRLVKAAFDDGELRRTAGLTTANSMNLGRLIPQTFYYFDAVAELRRSGITKAPLFSVPSGNFGNLTAGLMAWRLGLPAAGFIAATNENATVPRHLAGEPFAPRDTIATPSSAMDVSAPNNWPRVVSIAGGNAADLQPILVAESVDRQTTLATIRALFDRSGYRLDPHGAVGYAALARVASRRAGPAAPGVCLATAHPAKFNDVMAAALGSEVPLPDRLAACLELPRRGGRLAGHPGALANFLATLSAGGARHA